VIALTGLAHTIFLVPAGFLSDRAGRKNVMLIGALFASMPLLGRSIFEWEMILLILALASGAFMSFIQVSIIPRLAENSNEKQRIHLFSFHFAVMMAANVIGNLLGGVLTDLFTFTAGLSSLSSLRITLLFGPALYVTGLIPIFLMKENRKRLSKKTENTKVRANKKQQSKLVILLLFACV
jgi:MFS family permease